MFCGKLRHLGAARPVLRYWVTVFLFPVNCIYSGPQFSPQILSTRRLFLFTCTVNHSILIEELFQMGLQPRKIRSSIRRYVRQYLGTPLALKMDQPVRTLTNPGMMFRGTCISNYVDYNEIRSVRIAFHCLSGCLNSHEKPHESRH